MTEQAPGGERSPPKDIDLYVVIEGGVVQAVVTADPSITTHVNVHVIDYGVEDADANAVVPQGAGFADAKAWVYGFSPSQADIDVEGIRFMDEESDWEGALGAAD